ncbi:hydroxypyruvate isomerase [Phyllobacterium salinisoli]|uniref:Hydroxypyruvate isomerase n=1 Tax=Phyllobacterium salinisoli TaxID=1899321 RepID=A0A368K1I3_9HYPH|nr:2-oxo-tetronate isomerase [Phyllobacterium salinisoli]RCS22262.1 hydroxypyruvate isomerase [Phyllobacterium salinisoli]
MPRFAANLTMMFNEHAFPERFQAAAAAGFPAVEYLFPYDFPAGLIAEKLSAAGLKQALFNLPSGDWAKGERGLAALPERRQEFRQSVKQAIDYGRVIGTPLLHMMAGIASPDDLAAQTAYRDALAFAADAAGAEGIGLVIEPINGRDMPGYFLDDFDRAVEIITGLDRANLKLQFDIYHRQIMRGDVLAALEAMMPLIGHVQIASVPKRNEPGTGELDDFRVLRELDRLGYEGYVGCEYRPAGETTAGLDWRTRI